jgi:hypothetical protein
MIPLDTALAAYLCWCLLVCALLALWPRTEREP